MSKKQLFTDRLLAQMPSLRALRCFVTAARYESFTQAAEVLCVTQAAISRQIKELEDSLDVALFERTGRHIALTDAGRILYNASYLSIMNIAEAAEAVRRTDKHALTLCVSHTFSALWLSSRLPAFRERFPEIRLHVMVTEHFMELDELVEPDVIITKNPPREPEFEVEPLFHDIVYPVCSPSFHERHFRGRTLKPLDLLAHPTLNLSLLGRAQVCEHVDWRVWRNWFQQGDGTDTIVENKHLESNDYRLLVAQAEAGEGTLLGWHHLVHRQVEQGRLLRPVPDALVFRDRHHYLITHKNARLRAEYQQFRDWLDEEVGAMMRDWLDAGVEVAPEVAR
ncbi:MULTISPECIES: LysR substrate-binding domain-containing protein [Burkholderia cepacia complex]|uniref:LysR family transcriptional regulator n=2 Tax=Burkholderia cepacia complex TaxID=87882 RepID=A0A1B4PZN7_BURCE|nr:MULTISPECIES: LysR substrate-binding domain-containing protein [Burkholderia cepacia complex]AOK19410.1 LysR family transcriptional regulator [Burkholderia cepacia]AOK26169.1 LysR family transcriptional regulator [Burkholderia ubonensis]KVV19855.1 LysR family transcriptional regulator [Burkholderia ubonensis]KVZ69842.1 LysR family transcriptional regulator [Burkholderia ubonensis]